MDLYSRLLPLIIERAPDYERLLDSGARCAVRDQLLALRQRQGTHISELLVAEILLHIRAKRGGGSPIPDKADTIVVQQKSALERYGKTARRLTDYQWSVVVDAVLDYRNDAKEV